MYVVSGNRILRGAQQTKTTEPRVTLLKETTTNWKEVVMRQWKTHLPINEPLINLLGSYWRPSIFQGVLDSTSMFRHWNGRSIGQAMAGLLLTRMVLCRLSLWSIAAAADWEEMDWKRRVLQMPLPCCSLAGKGFRGNFPVPIPSLMALLLAVEFSDGNDGQRCHRLYIWCW